MVMLRLSSSLSLAALLVLVDQAAAQNATLPPVVIQAPKPARSPHATAPSTRGAGPASRRRAARIRRETAPAPRVAQTAPVSAPAPAAFNSAPADALTSRDVTREAIEREQPTTLGAALGDRVGAASTGYAPGGAERPILRGLETTRIRIQENGIGAQDVSALGEDHAVPINPLVQDKITVIRGPEALRYGSQAVGGIVNAENNRIPSFIPQGGYTARILTGYSTVSRGIDTAASVDAGSGNVAIHADGTFSKTEDYGTPRGRELNSAARHDGGAVGISWVGENGFVGIGASHSSSLYGIPGGDAAQSRTRLDPRQEKLFAKGEYRFEYGPFEAFRFWLGGSRYIHNETGLDEFGVRGIAATFKNREAEARAELSHVPVDTGFGRLTGLVGIQATRARLGTSGEAGGLLAPAASHQLAGYMFEQLDLGGGLRLQGAGRVEGSRVAGTAGIYPSDFLPTPDIQEPFSYASKREFVAKSASFGVLQDLPHGFVASLTGLYSERAPTAPELYSRGAHDATATFEIGDPNLKLERARSIEIGLRRDVGAFRFDAAAYYTRYTGFISKRFTGARCDDEFATCGSGEELRQIVYSQQNATFYGAEIAGQLDVLPLGTGLVGIEGRYDFVHATLDQSGPVPRLPPHRLGGGVYWRDGGWFARVSLLHAFDHTRVGAFETPTKGWDNLRAELSYTRAFDRRVAGVSEMTVGVRGENLLNDDIRNSASFRKDLILDPGRNVRLFVSAKF
jgi:iron complex outermembrane receptor protein